MSETPTNPAASAPEPEVNTRRGPSIVWLLPIVALLIGVGAGVFTYLGESCGRVLGEIDTRENVLCRHG